MAIRVGINGFGRIGRVVIRAAMDMIEKAVGCPIKYISVGAGREQYIER